MAAAQFVKSYSEKKRKCRFVTETQSLWWNVIPSFPGNYSAQARKDFFAYHTSSEEKNVLYSNNKSKNKSKHHPASKSIPRKDDHVTEKCSAQEYEIMKVCHRFRPIITPDKSVQKYLIKFTRQKILLTFLNHK